MIQDIYYNVCPRNYKATIDKILKLEHAKWFVYGQSWSTVSESDAMWRIYSYNRHSIQIKTTDTRLKNVISGIDDKRWYQMLSLSSMGANWKIYETVKDMSDDAILEEIEHRLDKYLGHINENNIPCNYYVDITELSKYIVGVKVNPFAEDWYVELVGNLCAEYKLQFYGRSELYKSEDVR